MSKFYFLMKNGELQYEAAHVLETPSYILLFEGNNDFFNVDVCNQIYRSKNNPQYICNMISGLFSIVLYDKMDKAIYMYQDTFGYLAPLYYFYSDKTFVCSLSLCDLIVYSDCEFSLNSEKLQEFLYSGFICLSDTLLNKVYKLNVLTMAIYKDSELVSIAYTPSWFKPCCSNYNNYEKIFTESVLSCVSKTEKELNITLSGGYDSNFILYVLNKLGYSIHAFTCGGSVGVDESVVTSKICNYYKNTSLDVCILSHDMLDKYPQIVLANEGALYERGIFMHYLLANTYKNNGIKKIINGDGADQVLSSNFVFNVTEYQHVGKILHNPWETNPFEMLVYIALKKTGIFLCKYNIVPQFPYLDRMFVNYISSIKELNSVNKLFHREKLKNIIPSAIYELLNRNGGSTNLKPLFKNRDVFYKYKIIAEESHFYKQFPSQPNRYGVEENEYDKVLKILYLIIFEKLFTNSQYRSALANGKINISLDKLLESV